MMGDFNGHNPLWGSKTITDKGNKLEDFLSQEGLCIFNDGTDTYIHPEIFIRNAFAKKEHVVSIFLDLEKAYDTTWTYGILKDLFDMALKG